MSDRVAKEVDVHPVHSDWADQVPTRCLIQASGPNTHYDGDTVEFHVDVTQAQKLIDVLDAFVTLAVTIPEAPPSPESIGGDSAQRARSR